VARPAPPPPPHAHLKHRAVPDTDLKPSTGALLRFWSAASLTVLLALLGLALLYDWGNAVKVIPAVFVVVMGVDAIFRGHFLLFLLGLLILVAVGFVVWLLVTHTRAAFGVLALVAALAIGLANLRTVFGRR
jgi:hypothetical protein